ncbi:dynamin family protein, partial [Escherichia coli]|nr:dynamin family protein [Escherichia coli]
MREQVSLFLTGNEEEDEFGRCIIQSVEISGPFKNIEGVSLIDLPGLGDIAGERMKLAVQKANQAH